MDERFYLMGGAQHEFDAKTNAMVTDLLRQPDANTEPQTSITLRTVGRKRTVSDEQKAANLKANTQNNKRDQKRGLRKATRKEIRAELDERAAEGKRRVKERREAQEQLMQLNNKKAMGHEIASSPVEISEYALITSGHLAIKGKTGVRLFDANNTIIYVKDGDSVADAVEKFKINRKIAVFF